MAIRVLLKRHVPEEKIEELRNLLDNLRLHAMDQPGYISGETLKRIDEPGIILVIGKWKSMREWQLWFDSPERKSLQDQIDELLGEETVYEVYDYD